MEHYSLFTIVDSHKQRRIVGFRVQLCLSAVLRSPNRRNNLESEHLLKAIYHSKILS